MAGCCSDSQKPWRVRPGGSDTCQAPTSWRRGAPRARRTFDRQTSSSARLPVACPPAGQTESRTGPRHTSRLPILLSKKPDHRSESYAVPDHFKWRCRGLLLQCTRSAGNHVGRRAPDRAAGFCSVANVATEQKTVERTTGSGSGIGSRSEIPVNEAPHGDAEPLDLPSATTRPSAVPAARLAVPRLQQPDNNDHHYDYEQCFHRISSSCGMVRL